MYLGGMLILPLLLLVLSAAQSKFYLVETADGAKPNLNGPQDNGGKMLDKGPGGNDYAVIDCFRDAKGVTTCKPF
jgi:hypothetical protein